MSEANPDTNEATFIFTLMNRVGRVPLLRLALLCHLFVSAAGADRIATNVACLPNEPGQVFMILAGASATQRS